jgi:hypothetical protein
VTGPGARIEATVSAIDGGGRWKPTKRVDRIMAFSFGVAGLIALVVLANAFPNPTPFQYLVCRIVLALAGAGIGAMIPGIFSFDTPVIKVGGAIVVFPIVFFFNPARLVVQTGMDVAPREEVVVPVDKGEVKDVVIKYVVTPVGADVRWMVRSDVPWLTLMTPDGLATEAKASDIEMSLNSRANALRLGKYVGTIEFENKTNNSGDTLRHVILSIGVDKFLSLPGVVPIREAYRPKLVQAIDRLGHRLQAELAASGRTKEIPWSVAQIVVGLQGKMPVTGQAIQSFVDRSIDNRTHAWRQFPESTKSPIHVAASAWVIFAYGRLGQQAMGEQLQFLLRQQAADGWWAIYPSKHIEQNACVYSTVWAALALKEHGDRDLIPARLKKEAADAVGNARAWLLRTRGLGLTEKARWKNYPFRVDFNESVSVSGLALHALHQMLKPEDLREIDQLWLESLPQVVPSASEKEESLNATIEVTAGTIDKDEVRLYKLPWIIVATVDAYPNGTRKQQAIAFDWLDTYLGARGQLDDEVAGEGNWVAAELLIALRHFLGEEVLR